MELARSVTSHERKQDRSSQCQYIQSSDIFFNVDIFCNFNRKCRIQSTRYYHICNQQVNFSCNRHLTCLVSKNLFLTAILIFLSKTRSAILAEVTNRSR